MAPMPNLGDPREFNNTNLPMGGEKAMLVLGQQPPLLGNVAMRLVHTKEDPNPCYEESQDIRSQEMIPTTLVEPLLVKK